MILLISGPLEVGAGAGAAGIAIGFGATGAGATGLGATTGAGACTTGAETGAGVVAGAGACLLDIKKKAAPPTTTTPITPKIMPLPPDLGALSVGLPTVALELPDSIRVGVVSTRGTTSTTGATTTGASSTAGSEETTVVVTGGGGAGATGIVGAIGEGADGAKGAAGDNGDGAPPNGDPVGLGAAGGIRFPHLMQNFAVSRTSAAQLGHFLVMAFPSIFISKFYHLP